MRNTCCPRLATLSVLLFICSITNPAEDSVDYVVYVGNEQLHFVAQPRAGYVFKARDNNGSMDSANRFLKSAGDVNISPIRGLGRKGIWVVYNEHFVEGNDKTLKSLTGYSEAQYVAPLFSSNGETVAIIPEIVIRVRPGTEIEQVQALCETVDCTIIKRMEFTEKEYLLEFLGPNAEEVFVTVEELGQAPELEWAAPNIAFRPNLCGQVIPNDEYFLNQWHLNNTGQSGGIPGVDINATEAWKITKGDPNIIVAVLDDGVDTDHPDLIGNLVSGYDFYDDDIDPNPTGDDAHGTACAGLIAAQGSNGIGVTGVTWYCKIMPIRIVGASGFITEANTARAIRWSANNGADVISNGWGVDFALPTIRSAIIDVTESGGIGRQGKGCVVLFASGNWATGGKVIWPAQYSEVIAVGATDGNDEVWYYSGRGPELDIVAPSGDVDSGGDIWTTDIVGSKGYNNRNPDIFDFTDKMGGTSGSCPIAAGVAALILSVNSSLTNIEVKSILLHSSRDLGSSGWDKYYGFGCVDAYAAVTMALYPQESILYVDVNAPHGDPDISDPNEDGSLEHPFDSIQKAINHSVYRDTVIVLPGIYTGEGNHDIDFWGKIITVHSQEGPETCIIDCEAKGRGFYFHNGEGLNSVVEGFTITNGYDNSGGGIFISDSSPTISNCTFTNNSATYDGGGMFNIESSPTIANCIFTENQANHGGGMSNSDNCSPTIANCIFTENQANYGGGMSNSDNCSPTITNCNFTGNYIENSGGGMCNIESSPTVTNCTFTGNSTKHTGGGMSNIESSPTITDCIFTENSGGGMKNSFSSDPTITNCIFTGNSANYGGGMSNIDNCRPTVINCNFIGNSGGGMYNKESSPTVTNCKFTGSSGHGMLNDWYSSSIIIDCNFAENSAQRGGGMYNSYRSSPTVTGCNFTENSADYGGGMYNNYYSNPTVDKCTFMGNSANRDGGGIYGDSDSSPIVNICIFTGNSANRGGGMYNDARRPTVTNCFFFENSANEHGGGMYNRYSGPTVTNCIFSGNITNQDGGGMYNLFGGPTLINCIVWGNAPDQINGSAIISYSNIQGGWYGENNIGVNPLFADPSNGDYHLKSQAGRWDPSSQSWLVDDVTSRCIDTGDPSMLVGDEPEPNGTRINMGAYGGTAEASMSLPDLPDI